MSYIDTYLQKIRENWKAGLSVALVSIPLSISLAVASKTSPTVGIITAIWAGLIASFFGGSSFNIIGPTGAISGIIAAYSFSHGMQSLAMLTLVTGVFISIAYLLRLERYLILIPSSVIHGFTLGVACIIGFNQLSYALGLHALPQHESLAENVAEIMQHLPEVSFIALALFAVSLVGLFVLRHFLPSVPGAIILAPIGIGAGYLCVTGIIPLTIQTLGDKFSNLSFTLFIAPTFWYGTSIIQTLSHVIHDVVPTAIVVAVIAILETMLSAKIADGMTHTRHNPRKEMFGLGLANIASGIMGGIPATAALARTSLNIKAGATDKVAGTISVIFIGLISLFLLSYFAYIPMAVIAAILVYVAIQMIEAEHFISFFRYEKTNFWISLLVAFVTFYKDPVIGILLGAAISLLILINKISQGQCDISTKFYDDDLGNVPSERLKEVDKNAELLLYSMKGKLCYINSRAHITRFETNLRKYKYIVIRLNEIYFIDLDGIAALDEIITNAENAGQKIVLTSIPSHILPLLEKTSTGYKNLKNAGLVFNHTRNALAYIIQHYAIKLTGS